MHPFLTIDETSINTHLETSDRTGYTLREAARAVVIDDNKKVALLHVSNGDYYKLPGGGIEEGEDVQDALARELLEEIGCKAEIIANLGTVREFRFYWNLEQLSYAYVARAIGTKGQPSFTDKEVEDGFAIVWVDTVQHAIHLLEQSPLNTQPESPKSYNMTFMRLRDSAIARKALPIIDSL